MRLKLKTKTQGKSQTASHIGSDGKPQHYVGTWIDRDDYLKLGLDAIENHRSIAGEIRNRILGTCTAHVMNPPVSDSGESSFKK